MKDETRGLWVIGNRISRYNPMTSPLSSDPQVLLPPESPLTTLCLKDAHTACGHKGRDGTISRFRHRFWTTNNSWLAKKIVNDCQLCRRNRPKFLSPDMGSIPKERLRASPPFTYVMVDLFGPYSLRGEIQKRTTGKGYGVIFSDLYSRAVHIEGVFGYDTPSLLMAINRSCSIRG